MQKDQVKKMEKDVNTNQGSLVPVNDLSQATALFGGSEEKPSMQWTSIPNDGTREAAIRIYNAFGDADNLSDLVGEVIEVENVAAHNVTVESEEAGAVEAVRCVLITPDGKRYACVADGVLDSLKKIFAVVGLPPWTPPVKVAAKNVKTRRGYRTLRLELRA